MKKRNHILISGLFFYGLLLGNAFADDEFKLSGLIGVGTGVLDGENTSGIYTRPGLSWGAEGQAEHEMKTQSSRAPLVNLIRINGLFEGGFGIGPGEKRPLSQINGEIAIEALRTELGKVPMAGNHDGSFLGAAAGAQLMSQTLKDPDQNRRSAMGFAFLSAEYGYLKSDPSTSNLFSASAGVEKILAVLGDGVIDEFEMIQNEKTLFGRSSGGTGFYGKIRTRGDWGSARLQAGVRSFEGEMGRSDLGSSKIEGTETYIKACISIQVCDGVAITAASNLSYRSYKGIPDWNAQKRYSNIQSELVRVGVSLTY